MKIKAVLDTNVLISGIFWFGAPLEILRGWQRQQFVLTVSLPILEEYRRVLEEMASDTVILFCSTPDRPRVPNGKSLFIALTRLSHFRYNFAIW